MAVGGGLDGGVVGDVVDLDGVEVETTLDLSG
jgi:hypothetical protein